MLFAEPGAHSVTTVLGSCISVCLWDPVSRTGGMNHYLLPYWNGDGLKTPKYGNIAIPMLLERLVNAGCRKGDLIAKVLVVDDSAVVRKVLSAIISSERDLEVIGTAGDPLLAAEKIAHEVPDVITLDVEMPRMDGLTFLQKMMSQHPIASVIISSLTEGGSETALKALEYGAVEIITKPKSGTKEFLEESAILICDAIRAAAIAKLRRPHAPLPVSQKLSAD